MVGRKFVALSVGVRFSLVTQNKILLGCKNYLTRSIMKKMEYNSVVECHSDTMKVGGSNPPTPTWKRK